VSATATSPFEPIVRPLVGREHDREAHCHVAIAELAAPVRLIDQLPDLAADLDDGQAAVARRAVKAPALQLGRGRLDRGLCETPHACGTPFGLVVVDGLLAREVVLGDRTSTSLYGPGDVIDLRVDEGSSLSSGATVVCPEDAVVAILDDRLLAAMREWPRMISRLFAITMRQLERADVNAAIGQLERVEDRLLGFFWLLADRWGRRGPGGIAIEQPLTHEAIGHLIGARRPTVSLGLRALADEGALTRIPGGTWLLSPGSLDRLIVPEAVSALPSA
jgi:CRP-like cAMP-binding protein